MKNSIAILGLFYCCFIFSCAQEIGDMESIPIQSEKPVLYSDLFCVGHSNEDLATDRQFIFNPTVWPKINSCEARTLKYYIDPACIGTVYELAISQAIAEYNALESSLHYTHTTAYNEAHLFFHCHEGGSCGGGATTTPLSNQVDPLLAPSSVTTFPSGGKIGAEVQLPLWDYCVCNDLNNCNSAFDINSCMFKRLVMHEIGHTIGIAHNDGVASNTVQWGPPAGYQETSVFNSGQQLALACNWCHIQLCNFNEHDITIIEKFYPALPELSTPEIAVFFDPCSQLIHLFDNANPQTNSEGWEFQWFVLGLSNTPEIQQENPGRARVGYEPGEEVCIYLKIEDPCGNSVFSDELCYITPACPNHGNWIPGVPITKPECTPFGGCPAGFECLNGVCVPIVAEPECHYNWDCPEGYDCKNGICVKPNNNDCVHGQCPPGFTCKLGQCEPIPDPN